MQELHITSLLLAVVDSNNNKLFRYVHAGALSCLGGAGLFQRSALKKSIESGCLRIRDISVAGQQRHRTPYPVGAAAFGLTEFMQKNICPPPDTGSAQAKFNKRLTDCWRKVEAAFGDLKGWWVVCKAGMMSSC
jgi:hypothetical protein